MDRERVTYLGPFDVERPCLWVDERVDDGAARKIGPGANFAAEGILGEKIEDLTGPDPEYRVVSAEGPRVLIRGRNEPGESTI